VAIVRGTTLRQSVIRFSGRMTVATRLAVCSTLWVLASCVLLTAQNVVLTGALSGRVTDQSGAVVPGVSVAVRNLATRVQHSVETNHAGLYWFPAVMPGSYSVHANPKGFREVEAPGASAGGKHHFAGHQASGGTQRRRNQSNRNDATAAADGIFRHHGA
jgi:hypothetical protein